MSTHVITLRDDEQRIVENAVDLAIDAAGQLTAEAKQPFYAQIRAAVADPRTAGQLQDASNDVLTLVLDCGTRLGFFLGLSLASHGASGDRAWLAEALRLAGEDVAVEVRQAEA